MFVGPIIARELLTTPRRPKHYGIRAAYAGLLFVLMWTAWQQIIGFQQNVPLGAIACFHGILFQLFSYMELTILLFGAALFGSSSISHEKDRRTFILLLVTRLKDSEIIVNKFLAGLVQVGTILIASLPVFALCMLLGGISGQQVGEVFAVFVGTIIFGSATGVLVAAWREKTFQSVALTILVIMLGQLIIEFLRSYMGGTVVAGYSVQTWVQCLSPYRTLQSAITRQIDGGLTAPLDRPAWCFLSCACLFAVVTLTFTTIRMRAWNPRGEPIQQPDEEERPDPNQPAAPTKKRDPFRRIWDNPVLWREIRTFAYGTKPILVKVGYLAIAAILVSGMAFVNPNPEDAKVQFEVVKFVMPLAILSLMLINTQAVTAVTAERDLKSIDLLLVTDITAREFVYGKLAGILYNSKEMVLAPILFLVGCWWYGLTSPLALVYVSSVYLMFVLFCSVLGIHAALRYDSTRVAISNSLGTVFLLFVGILICLFLIMVSGKFEYQFLPFLLFVVIGSMGLWLSLSASHPSSAIVLTAAIAPVSSFYCVVAFLQGDQTGPFLVANGVYAFAVASMLIPLISEFDVATGRTTID